MLYSGLLTYRIGAGEIEVTLGRLNNLPLHLVLRGDRVKLALEDLDIRRVGELVGLNGGSQVSLAGLVCQVVKGVLVGGMRLNASQSQCRKDGEQGGRGKHRLCEKTSWFWVRVGRGRCEGERLATKLGWRGEERSID